MRQFIFGLMRLTLAAAISAGSALAQGPPSSVQIFMPNGGLPAGVIRLTLVRDDGFTDNVFTDSKGKFEIATPRTQSITYTITIEGDKQTYETTTVSLRLEGGNPNNLTIFLKPISIEKRRGSAVLDVANLEGNIPAKARAAYSEGKELISEGRIESAITSLRQAISIYPQYLRALNDLGVLFMRVNRLDEAETTFRQAVDVSKRFFHSRMNLGLVLKRQGKFKEAVEILGPLYEENHGMLDVRLAYAGALNAVGEVSKAEKLCRATLELPNLPESARADLHFEIGVGLNRQGKFAEAATELEKAIVLSPDAANFHLQLGGALMQLQQLERAERELLRAYELGGNSAGGAQLLLGHVYYTQKKFPEAQRAFEQYLKDFPTAPNAAQITQLIASLKATQKK
ncbi:MAG: tetratricopeptide repeat protein [Pyrinomonadaceae bacterium]